MVSFSPQPIRDWLYHNRIKQVDAAKKLGISLQTLSPLLKKNNMSVKNLIKLLALTNFEVKFEDCLKNRKEEAA